MQDVSTIRRRIEMQGFIGIDDSSLRSLDPWLRLAPASNLIVAGIGTATASALLLWCAVSLSLAAALFRSHPIDLVYNHGVRRMLDGPRLSRYQAPRRFAFAFTSALLLATGWAFLEGALATGYTLGGMTFALAQVQVLSGFCFGSWVHEHIFGRRPDPGSLPAPSSAVDR